MIGQKIIELVGCANITFLETAATGGKYKYQATNITLKMPDGCQTVDYKFSLDILVDSTSKKTIDIDGTTTNEILSISYISFSSDEQLAAGRITITIDVRQKNPFPVAFPPEDLTFIGKSAD